jgi:hypothetical protein
MMTDVDVFFNGDPFTRMVEFSVIAQRKQQAAKAKRRHSSSLSSNYTYFGSFDGGTWETTTVSLQYKMFHECFPKKTLDTFTPENWQTYNGNTGLWAATPEVSECILTCMSSFITTTTRGKFCDMALHDYCVHFGTCFPTTNTTSKPMLWGKETLKVFGPRYASHHEKCLSDEFIAVHNRCDTPWKPPICFSNEKNKDGGVVLRKYHQVNQTGTPKRCRLDPTTDLPL